MSRLLMAACLAAMVSLPAGASAADSFRDLQAAYRCDIVRRLEQIHAAGNPASSRNRYLAVNPAKRPEHYVQCIFHDANTKAYCEAASGFYLTKPEGPHRYRAAAATIAALARLGFDTDDSAGNFEIDRGVGAPPDFNALADFILRALHDGYGVRAGMTLTFNAPFAPDVPTSCVPMS